MNRIDLIEMEQMKKNIPPFKAGDTVKVHVKIVEGDKSRIQAFQGSAGRTAAFANRSP
jgi:large subunit ribosomal protein L19